MSALMEYQRLQGEMRREREEIGAARITEESEIKERGLIVVG